jgi:hypothetical protein
MKWTLGSQTNGGVFPDIPHYIYRDHEYLRLLLQALIEFLHWWYIPMKIFCTHQTLIKETSLKDRECVRILIVEFWPLYIKLSNKDF